MVKRASEKYNAIQKIKSLLKITQSCTSEDDIVENITIGDKNLEFVAIKLFVDKYLTNKYFDINAENYNLCKIEAKRLFN